MLGFTKQNLWKQKRGSVWCEGGRTSRGIEREDLTGQENDPHLYFWIDLKRVWRLRKIIWKRVNPCTSTGHSLLYIGVTETPRTSSHVMCPLSWSKMVLLHIFKFQGYQGWKVCSISHLTHIWYLSATDIYILSIHVCTQICVKHTVFKLEASKGYNRSTGGWGQKS